MFNNQITNKVQVFLLQDFINIGEKFHVARVTIHSRQDLSLHCHDYAEIFWVERGKGIHLINGVEVTLQPGHLVMIRPEDQHTFTSDRSGMTIMNVAFPLDTLTHFRSRYFPESLTYFWTSAHLPYHKLLQLNIINQISKRAESYWKCQKNDLYADSLLLSIFRFIGITDGSSLEDKEVPAWLNTAIQEFSSPDYFKSGPKGFSRLCGKNVDYVNRTVKRVYYKTLTELVNELRMHYAAEQLSLTNVPIKTICNNCGFVNLAHFYSLFKETYHLTPSLYRKNNQTIV